MSADRREDGNGTESAGTVLVVDDEPHIRRLIAEALTTANFAVVTAGTGADGLRRAPEARPDVALVDLVLPDISGLEVIDGLLEHRDLVGLPVIAITGSLTREQLNACLSRGAHDYIAKPFGIGELLARVRAAVRIKRVQDDLRRTAARLGAVEQLDELTGLASAQQGERRLTEMISGARRHGRPLSALLVDVDRLHAVNVELGRRRGDAVLRAVATRLLEATRTEDVVARYEEDSFLVVLPEIDGAGAGQLAGRLAEEIHRRPVMVDGVPLEVSVAVSRAQWEGETLPTFLDRLRDGLASPG